MEAISTRSSCQRLMRCYEVVGSHEIFIIDMIHMQAALDAFEEGEGGRVEQVKPDGSYMHPQPLSKAHEMCVARARKKAVTRKAESMAILVLPDGSHVDFTKATRAAIDPKLIQRIR